MLSTVLCGAGILISLVGITATPWTHASARHASRLEAFSGVDARVPASAERTDPGTDREPTGPGAGARGAPRYAYSVVPDGVRSASDLEAAIQAEPVVARHYASLDLRRVRLVHLSRARRAYASYRVGGRIFWTRRALVIPGGEAVLTDGVNWVRARCGNRLSEQPQQPVNTGEPPPAALDTPLPIETIPVLGSPPMLPAAPAAADGSRSDPLIPFGSSLGGVAPLGSAIDAALPQPVDAGSLDIPPGDFPPVVDTPRPGSDGSTGVSSPPSLPDLPGPPGPPPDQPPDTPGPPDPPPPPVVTPEPSTLLLLGSGLAVYAARRRRSGHGDVNR